MVDRFISAFLAPRAWLIAAALCLAGWVAVGYHQDQMNAALVLGQAGEVATDPQALTPIRQTLLGVALVMLVISGLLTLPFWSRKSGAHQKPKARQDLNTGKTDAFQPIRTQEELSVEEQAKAAPPKSRLSRVVSQIAETVFSVRTTSKNQP